jgi:hypothetical protein
MNNYYIAIDGLRKRSNTTVYIPNEVKVISGRGDASYNKDKGPPKAA